MTSREETTVTLINAAEESFDLGGRRLPLSGSYDPRFRGVVEAFVENYRLGDELGSAVSIVVDGRTVVDVWGGWTDLNRQTEWQRDTIVCMMSVAKGITAAGFFVLVDRGLIDVDAPVATYWPEFAQNGKADIPVRHVLDHRSGLPVVTDRLVPRGAIYDREAMVRALEAQPPLWPTGEVAAYHILTQGYLLGEIMRRVSGQTVGPFVRENVTGPLGADYHIGLPASEDERVAELFPHPEARLLASRDVDEPDSLRAIAFIQHPEQPWGDILNSREWRAAEIASASGHGNARAVARVYAALARGGELDGVRLMSEQTLALMTSEQHSMIERMQERHYRQGLGILLNSPEAVYMGPHPAAFGHHGIGGSIGFADPVARVGFSYAMNAMHSVGTNGPRARRLIDALYAIV